MLGTFCEDILDERSAYALDFSAYQLDFGAYALDFWCGERHGQYISLYRKLNA